MVLFSLVLLLYVLIAVWIVVDSRQTRGKAPATHRFGAFIWGKTGAVFIAFFVVAWWFLRAFSSAFISLVWDVDFAPSKRDTDRAKEYLIFPHELIAFGLTGRGEFQFTPNTG